MTVKSNISSDGTKLTLEFDNSDKDKFEEVIKSWRFKDVQSLIRFSVTILLEGKKSKIIGYEDKNGNMIKAKPSKDLIND